MQKTAAALMPVKKRGFAANALYITGKGMRFPHAFFPNQRKKPLTGALVFSLNQAGNNAF